MNDNPLQILLDEVTPAPQLGADEVLTAGRRRVRRRRTAAVTVAATVVLVMTVGVATVAAQRHAAPQPADPTAVPSPAPSASAQPRCTSTRLTTPSNTSAAVPIIDPTGTYVVATTTVRSGFVLWSGGKWLSEESSGQRRRATAVNAGGKVVGFDDRDSGAVPFTATPEYVVNLTLPSGATGAKAYAINTDGDVVGEAQFKNGGFRAVLWKHKTPMNPTLLATPSGGRSTAFGIGDDGRITGSLNDGQTPYLWLPDGTGHALAALDGHPGGAADHIAGDWAEGPVDFLAWSTINSNTGRRQPNAAGRWGRWNLTTGAVTQITTPAHTLNVLGGYGLTTDGTVLVMGEPDTPFLWRDGTAQPLTTAGKDRLFPSSISADGSSITAYTVSTEQEAVLLRCVSS